MIEIIINDVTMGFTHSVQSAYKPIEHAYSLLDDQYSDVVEWSLINHDNGAVCWEKMEAGMWFACCEDESAFSAWVKLFGWNRQDEE